MATSSIITRGSSSLANFTVRSRPKVDIILANQTDGLVPSFTTGDTIKGTVTITVDHDTRFDDLEITFEGTSRTSVERQSMPGRTGAYHTFLRLRQPIDESAYPTPRVLEPGRNYEFPFTFVVPERLLPHICNHAKTNLHVEQSHTLLPPSFGDPMIASNRKSVIDDMAPEMCRISYLVRVTLQRKPMAQNASPVTLVSVGKKVRVIPAVDEEPPLNVEDNDGLYSVRKEKDVKRGLMRGKLGRLVLAAAQPKPVQLTPSDTGNCDSVSTVATMQLRFDPVGDEQPPRLGTVWSKLRVSTFYSSDPWGDYPSAACIKSWAQMGRAMYTETVPLSTMCVASAQWTKHTDTDLERRDSMHSTSSTDSLPSPSASFAGNTYYTASVVVPVTLPKAKSFVPTFYSCLIARAYALELSISYHAANSRILTPTASLKVPLQLTCEARPGTGTKGTVVDISQDEVNTQFFSPRSIAPPSVSELVPIAPPAYTSVQVSNLPPDRSRMLPPSVTNSGSVRV